MLIQSHTEAADDEFGQEQRSRAANRASCSGSDGRYSHRDCGRLARPDLCDARLSDSQATLREGDEKALQGAESAKAVGPLLGRWTADEVF